MDFIRSIVTKINLIIPYGLCESDSQEIGKNIITTKIENTTSQQVKSSNSHLILFYLLLPNCNNVFPFQTTMEFETSYITLNKFYSGILRSMDEIGYHEIKKQFNYFCWLVHHFTLICNHMHVLFLLSKRLHSCSSSNYFFLLLLLPGR